MLKLIEYRRKSRLSQAALAEILKIPQRTYANYELRNRAIPFVILNKLCDFYGISLDELTGRIPPRDSRTPDIA